VLEHAATSSRRADCGGGIDDGSLAALKRELRAVLDEVLSKKFEEVGLAPRQSRFSSLDMRIRKWSARAASEAICPPPRPRSSSIDVLSVVPDAGTFSVIRGWSSASEASTLHNTLEIPGSVRDAPDSKQQPPGGSPPNLPMQAEDSAPQGHDAAVAWNSVRSKSSLPTTTSKDMQDSTDDNGQHISPSIYAIKQRFSKRAMSRSLPAKFQDAGSIQLFCAALILNQRFDYCVSLLILANAAAMGASVNHAALQLTTQEPMVFGILDKIFCGLFTVELVLRLVVHRGSFFCGSEMLWNIFDMCIVLFQLMEEVMVALAYGKLGITGVLRLLRLVRVIRLARILRLIRELRVLVTSISNSMKSLMWTILLMFLIIYSVSLCITQLVSDHRLSVAESRIVAGAVVEGRDTELEQYFGSLWRSMLSLFQAITGGVDWDTLVVPLIQDVHPALAIVFVLYVAVMVLAILNVVTGVFVDSVLASAKADKEQYLLNSARQLFKTKEEEMDWASFQSKMHSPQMLEFFKGIDVDPSDAKSIFSLIDADESGSISVDEFLNGCVRLHGPSKALETAVLSHEIRSLRRSLTRLEHAT